MFADPDENIKQFGLREGMHVADLGAGSGFYTLAAAHVVGPGGKVYAVEVQKELMERVQTEAVKVHLTNVEVIWGNIEKPGGTKIADAAVDAVIASNVMFQVPDKPAFVAEIKRILKSGGRVLVIDWTDSFGGLGPLPADIISKENAQAFFHDAGFVFEREIAAGAHHYGLVLKK